MRKLNNKGFAIASILYSIMVLFLMLLLSILGILGSRKATLDKNKKDIINDLNKAYVVNKFTFEHKDITVVNIGNLDDINYALMDGVKAIDAEGKEIGKEFIRYDLNINNIENKTYNVTYTANSNGQTIVGTRLITFIPETNVTTFAYKGSAEEFTPTYNGSYKIELWGAQGGNADEYIGGLGGYTSGIINLSKIDNIYVYVGQQGTDDFEFISSTISDSNGDGNIWPYNYYKSSITYNGGSYSVNYRKDTSIGSGMAGGGSTDVRLANGNWDDFISLKSRIMVASGGSGSGNYFRKDNGMAGGNLIGNDGFVISGSDGVAPTGGSQILGGLSGRGLHSTDSTDGTFGKSGQGVFGVSSGGSGYYGGGASPHGRSTVGIGASGSSFISGYDGCDAISEESTEDNIIHTGQSIHYSGYKFDNPVMYAGNEAMPTHDGASTMTGNSGDGYAKISLIYYY